jgi:hypothetical protein
MHNKQAGWPATQIKERIIHAPFQAKMLQKAHEYCAIAFGSAAATLALLLSNPAHALDVDGLQPTVRDALKAHPLAKAVAPVPAFTWTLEKSRTLRKMHAVTEVFAGAANGLSPVVATDRRGDAVQSVRKRVSLRGLEQFDADDGTVNLSVQGVDVPPKSGSTFSVTLKKDGETLTKSCKAGEKSPAANLFASLPGEMLQIQCAGSGTVKGINVKTASQLVWLEALGVFLPLSEQADAALGKFTETVKITKFSMGSEDRP